MISLSVIWGPQALYSVEQETKPHTCQAYSPPYHKMWMIVALKLGSADHLT